MKVKLPPPLVLLVWVLIMWLLTVITNSWRFTFPAQTLVSAIFLAAGFIITIVAIIGFRAAATTINPMSPEKASSLVTSGIFSFSRNPMYLGMLLVLIAWFFHLGSLLNLAALYLFYLFITRFQIEPEEQALRKLFGDAYDDYCARVRRWI